MPDRGSYRCVFVGDGRDLQGKGIGEFLFVRREFRQRFDRTGGEHVLRCGGGGGAMVGMGRGPHDAVVRSTAWVVVVAVVLVLFSGWRGKRGSGRQAQPIVFARFFLFVFGTVDHPGWEWVFQSWWIGEFWWVCIVHGRAVCGGSGGRGGGLWLGFNRHRRVGLVGVGVGGRIVHLFDRQ